MFKKWLKNQEILEAGVGLATTGSYGGAGLPLSTTNDNMPVRSKYATADGEDNQKELNHTIRDKSGKPTTIDNLWNGKKRSGMKQSKERRSMWIDKNRRSVPIRDDRPDIVY